jgi:hypothetical protein
VTPITDDAKQTDQAAQGQPGPPGHISRLLLVLTLIACVGAVATGLYGVFKFPDAPIRQTAGGYFGKGGRPRTKSDFEAFVKWQRAMFIVFPSAFIFGFAYGITDSIQRRRHGT